MADEHEYEIDPPELGIGPTPDSNSNLENNGLHLIDHSLLGASH